MRTRQYEAKRALRDPHNRIVAGGSNWTTYAISKNGYVYAYVVAPTFKNKIGSFSPVANFANKGL